MSKSYNDRGPKRARRHGLSSAAAVWLVLWAGVAAWLWLGRAPGAPPSAVGRPAGDVGTVASSGGSGDRQVITVGGRRYAARPIELVRVGDLVATRDQHADETAPIELGRVESTFRRTVAALRDLRVTGSSGRRQELRTTDEHPFWVLGRGWVKAGDLAPGDRLTGLGGETLTLVQTRSEPRPEGVSVYNFKVQDSHTYFVSAAGSPPTGPPIWVHNAECLMMFHGTLDTSGAAIRADGFHVADTFFGDYRAAKYFAYEAMAKRGAPVGAKTGLLQYIVPHEVAVRLGSDAEHVIGEYAGLRFPDIDYSNGMERILTYDKVREFNRLVKEGIIKNGF